MTCDVRSYAKPKHLRWTELGNFSSSLVALRVSLGFTKQRFSKKSVKTKSQARTRSSQRGKRRLYTWLHTEILVYQTPLAGNMTKRIFFNRISIAASFSHLIQLTTLQRSSKDVTTHTSCMRRVTIKHTLTIQSSSVISQFAPAGKWARSVDTISVKVTTVIHSLAFIDIYRGKR